MNNKLSTLIANGALSVEELANANELIERAELVKKGIAACKQTLVFPLGTDEISCYDYTDGAGEYHSWGTCTSDGTFRCSCNWGGNHEIGSCNIIDFKDVFLAFDNEKLRSDLRRFLLEQIQLANAE